MNPYGPYYPGHPPPGPYQPTPVAQPLPHPHYQEETGLAEPMVHHWPEYPAWPFPFLEGQREWQETDSVRWGDSDAIEVDVPLGGAGLPTLPQASRQLINAHVPRPTTWLIQTNAIGTMPAGEAAAVNIDFAITLGAGQGRTTIHVVVALTAAGGYLPPNPPPQIFIPAGDLQVVATILSFAPTVIGPHIVSVGCMCAPFHLIPTRTR